MTLLKAANVFFFQWLFMRLTKCLKNVEEGGYTKTYSWFSLQMWIVPCTGWWSNFIYLGKNRKFIKLTKEKRDNPRLT